MRVLTVCQHNAGRSQMAAAFLRAAHPGWDVSSAGVGPDLRGVTVPESVVDVLAEVDVALDPLTRRRLLTPEMVDAADCVVMLVEPERWPSWLPAAKVVFWPVPDPRGLPVGVLRAARDDIAARAATFAGPAVGPGRLRRVVCLPGFGDAVVGERWVSELRWSLMGAAGVEAWDWPGLWSRWSEPVSFAALVAEVVDAASPDTVFVGHSLGGRVALQVAASSPVAGVVAVCSPANLDVVAAGAPAARWSARGSRPTRRVAPNGMRVSFELPVVFLDELNAWAADAVLPSAPTLLVFGENDSLAAADDWRPVRRLGPPPAVQVMSECGHRFMDDARSRLATVAAVELFVRSLP